MAVTYSYLSLGATQYNVNETTEQLAVVVTAAPAPTSDTSFELHWGKASVIPTGDVAATTKDYIAKIGSAYPTGVIKAGQTSATVNMQIERNLLAHPDEVATIHLTKVEPTASSRALSTAKQATVIIHQDDPNATVGASRAASFTTAAGATTGSVAASTPITIAGTGLTPGSGTFQLYLNGSPSGSAGAITIASNGTYSFTAFTTANLSPGTYKATITDATGAVTSNNFTATA